jgi:5-(carboxyamino)imidazole ribonucleotide synthase
MRVGILGGGQLGWMTILEGRKLGFEFFVADDMPHSPARKVADLCFDYSQIDEFVKLCDVITYEFEHIPEEVLEKTAPLTFPSVEILKLKKSKVEEKLFLKRRGYPVPTFTVAFKEDLEQKVGLLNLPVVVKAEALGYDGKGQYLVKSLQDLQKVKANHGEKDRFLVEEFVDFDFELSIIGVRSPKGEVRLYPPTINHHREGILFYNRTTSMVFPEGEEIVRSLMEESKPSGCALCRVLLHQGGETFDKRNGTKGAQHRTSHLRFCLHIPV